MSSKLPTSCSRNSMDLSKTRHTFATNNSFKLKILTWRSYNLAECSTNKCAIIAELYTHTSYTSSVPCSTAQINRISHHPCPPLTCSSLQQHDHHDDCSTFMYNKRVCVRINSFMCVLYCIVLHCIVLSNKWENWRDGMTTVKIKLNCVNRPCGATKSLIE